MKDPKSQDYRSRQEALNAIADSVLEGDEDWQTRYARQIEQYGFTEEEVNSRAHAIIDERGVIASGTRPSRPQALIFVTLLLFLGAVAYLLVSGEMLPIFADRLSLAERSFKNGDFDKAEQYYGEVLKSQSGSDARSSIWRAEAITGMARIRLRQGKYQEAEKLVQDSLQIRRRLPAHERPVNRGSLVIDDYANGPKEIAGDLSLYADVLAAEGKTAEAEKLKSESTLKESSKTD